MLVRLVMISVLAAMLGTNAVARTSINCTDAESISADNAAHAVHNWATMYQVFRNYARCDDGAIAEQLSDRVEMLLTNQWQSVRELSHLAASEPRFKEFVLNHIDVTMYEKGLSDIAFNAIRRCPHEIKALCEKIATKAKNPE
jgi:hypothetical protein